MKYTILTICFCSLLLSLNAMPAKQLNRFEDDTHPIACQVNKEYLENPNCVSGLCTIQFTGYLRVEGFGRIRVTLLIHGETCEDAVREARETVISNQMRIF